MASGPADKQTWAAGNEGQPSVVMRLASHQQQAYNTARLSCVTASVRSKTILDLCSTLI